MSRELDSHRLARRSWVVPCVVGTACLAAGRAYREVESRQLLGLAEGKVVVVRCLG